MNDQTTPKMGRPRIHNREQIAKDIIEWAKLPDSINVNKFCAFYEPPFPCRKLSEWADQDENFRLSYEIAKNFLAFRREEWLNSDQLHVKAYDLTAPAYDYVIKEEKRAQAKFEKELEKDQSSVDPVILHQYQQTMKMLNEIQSVSKKDCSNNNNDKKS